MIPVTENQNVSFEIYSLTAGTGTLAISPIPGRFADFENDLSQILNWRPDLVLSMTEQAEFVSVGAGHLSERLAQAGIDWLHLPIRDYSGPQGATLAAWPVASARARAVLHSQGRVLIHCFGGCGRSGMAALRILIDMGVEPEAALIRVRSARPCAVETDDQMAWALTQ